MKKRDSVFFLIVVLYFFIVVFFFLYFISFSNTKPVQVYNVQEPLTSVSNDYAISLNEQIKQNISEIKNAFSHYPNSAKLNINSVSKLINIKVNGVSGTAPYCSASVSSIKNKCTSLSEFYLSLKPYLNTLKINFSPPHNISNYYVFKYNGSYYFMDNNIRKTIYNKGFPIYYVKG
jgi:hypothetical protein